MELTEMVKEYYIPTVFILCLCVGYLLKKFAPTDNKWIPLTVGILGAVCGCITLGEFTIAAITKGLVTGLASTGFHQAFTQLVEHPKAGGENASNYEDGHEADDPEDALAEDDGEEAEIYG